MRAIREMVRLLRPGGRSLIYAWARDQKRKESGDPSSYLKQGHDEEVISRAPGEGSGGDLSIVVCEKLALPVHRNRTDFKHSDLLVPWKKAGKGGPETLHRFYHVLEEGELEASVSEAVGDEVELEESYYDEGNWCVRLRKT